jgi:4-amino-4-deoxy-L-arabinose transferase-like glycosyltransferase
MDARVALRRRALALAGLMAIAALCNMGKAVHMDDTAYLEMARGILSDPLRPMSVQINWDQSAQPAYLSINTPPLFPYVLAGSMFVTGESDLALHATMALVAGLVIVLFYRVANRMMPRRAVLLTALFTLSPAFLPGQNLMTDVPLVGAWLWCMDVLLAGDSRAHPAYCPAGVAIAVACLIKYTGLALIPLLVITLAHRRQFRSLWAVMIPIGALTAWCAWNYVEFGGFHLFSRPNTFHVSSVGPHLLEWMAGVGVAAPFGAVLMARRISGWRSALIRLLPIAAGSAAFASTRAAQPSEPDLAWLWALSIGVGATILLSIGERVLADWRTDDVAARDQSVVLLVWLLAAAGSVMLITPFMSMRQVLLAMPPVILLCGKAAEPLFDGRWLRLAAVGVTAGLGLTLASSDYTYANVYRKYALQAARAGAPGSAVWAVGHWGWQWYAREAGLHIYDQQETTLHAGDYVVVPLVVSGQELRPDHRQQLRLVTTVTVRAQATAYLRTMGSGASYYGFYWHRAFPFRFATAPLESFSMYVVDR